MNPWNTNCPTNKPGVISTSCAPASFSFASHNPPYRAKKNPTPNTSMIPNPTTGTFPRPNGGGFRLPR